MGIYLNGTHLENCEIEVKGLEPMKSIGETENRERHLGPHGFTAEMSDIFIAPEFILYLYACALIDRLNKAKKAAEAEGKQIAR